LPARELRSRWVCLDLASGVDLLVADHDETARSTWEELDANRAVVLGQATR
jgi:hypothetical protein